MAWTGQNDEALAAKRATLPTTLPLSTTLPVSTKSTKSTTEASFIIDDIPFNNIWLALAFLVINVLAAIAWFFKGSAWATKTPPRPGAQPIRANELRNRLLAINQTGTPVEVTDNGDTIDITWRYADARWLDHAKAHGMRRIHKLSLDLSEDDHTVRVREYMSAVDWSAGVDAASIQWRAAIGIQFFQYEH
ncbi:MAG: hypothetical protein SGI88_09165 [Candidatus Hydrogenedentes bacterium]|nr:hypothetical protein [Candidatus Hydrogenedentota bacterium]